MFADFIKRQLEKKIPEKKIKLEYKPPSVYAEFPKDFPRIPDSVKLKDIPIVTYKEEAGIPTNFKARCPNCGYMCDGYSMSRDFPIRTGYSMDFIPPDHDVDVRFSCPKCYTQWSDIYSVFLKSRNVEMDSSHPPPSFMLPDGSLRHALPLPESKIGFEEMSDVNKAFEAYLQKLGESLIKIGYLPPRVHEIIDQKRKERIIPKEKRDYFK